MSKDFSKRGAGMGGSGSTSSESKSDIDWEGYNQALVDACGTQDKAKSVSGVISGITYLGLQKQEDAKMEWNGDAAKEAEEIEKRPDTYFEDGLYGNDKGKRFKRWPKKDQDSFAITVDFPKFPMDYDKFFGDGTKGAVPYRALLNGEFTPKGSKESILNRLYEVKWDGKRYKEDKVWTLTKNSILHKLAVAAEVIGEDDAFTPDRLGELIGKWCQFQLRVFKNEKGYVNEKITFKGAVPEEVREIGFPEVDSDSFYFVRLDDPENDQTEVDHLRKVIKNQIKKSTQYEGSPIQLQLGDTPKGGEDKENTPEEESLSPKTPATPEPKAPPLDAMEDDGDDDEPF